MVLRSVSLKPTFPKQGGYPFDLPVFAGFDGLDLRSPVTFLVGENGTGKSTLLEGIAAGAGSVAIGGEDISGDPTLGHARRLAKHLLLTWEKKTTRGFFLRAEDVFNFSRRINRMGSELEELATEYEKTLTGDGLARALGASRGQKVGLQSRYGVDADARSHGETFLHLFQERLVPGGLHILDEPEAPLSPLRQLAFLSIVKEMVGRDAQFVVATHSPILMAFPGARIYDLDSTPAREVAYEDLEHVTLTRNFLNNPETFLRRL